RLTLCLASLYFRVIFARTRLEPLKKGLVCLIGSLPTVVETLFFINCQFEPALVGRLLIAPSWWSLAANSRCETPCGRENGANWTNHGRRTETMRWFRPEVHDLPLKASRSSRWAALAITDDPEAFSLCRTCIAERPLLAAALCTDRTVIHGAGLLRTTGTRPATRAVPVAARAFGARWPFSATFAVVQDAIAIRPRHAGVSEAAALSAALRAYR